MSVARSREGSTVRNRIELNDVVRKAKISFSRKRRHARAKCPHRWPTYLPPVEGNLTQIQQVLINLSGNAFDAMNDTPVTNRKVELTTEHNGNDTVRVAVRDHGVGIPNGFERTDFRAIFYDEGRRTRDGPGHRADRLSKRTAATSVRRIWMATAHDSRFHVARRRLRLVQYDRCKPARFCD